MHSNPLNINGLHNIRKIRWQNLQTGMVVIGGISINDQGLPELKDFPVITTVLRSKLFKKYQLLYNRELIVADVLPGIRHYDISDEILSRQRGLVMLNQVRKDYSYEKAQILKDCGLPADFDIPLLDFAAGHDGAGLLEREYLIRDTYNSFSWLYGLGSEKLAEVHQELPSLFDQIDLTVSIGELLTNKISGKYRIPDDSEMMLHIVVDYSRSMESAGKLGIAVNAVNYLCDSIGSLMGNTNIQLYVFADECRPVAYPLSGGEIKKGDTNYAGFIRKVLHHRNRDIPNKVLLFTDGLPSDRPEALKMAGLLKKNKVDYTQLVFEMKEEKRNEIELGEPGRLLNSKKIVDNIIKDEEMSPDMQRISLDDNALNAKMQGMFADFTEIAELAGGNQVILKINTAMKLVAIECYDKYMGLLTYGKARSE